MRRQKQLIRGKEKRGELKKRNRGRVICRGRIGKRAVSEKEGKFGEG